LRRRLRGLTRQRRRFGTGGLHILLLREGVRANFKRTQRLYTEKGLTVRKRKPRRRAIGTRAPLPMVAHPNQRWSLGFVHDQLVGGRRFRVLNSPKSLRDLRLAWTTPRASAWRRSWTRRSRAGR